MEFVGARPPASPQLRPLKYTLGFSKVWIPFDHIVCSGSVNPMIDWFNYIISMFAGNAAQIEVLTPE